MKQYALFTGFLSNYQSETISLKLYVAEFIRCRIYEPDYLAFIAMEFLKGKDLVPCTKTDNLLPLAQVMSIIDRVAEALTDCLAGVIHKALAKQVGERYRDGEEMAKVLRACVAAV